MKKSSVFQLQSKHSQFVIPVGFRLCNREKEELRKEKESITSYTNEILLKELEEQKAARQKLEREKEELLQRQRLAQVAFFFFFFDTDIASYLKMCIYFPFCYFFKCDFFSFFYIYIIIKQKIALSVSNKF